MTTSVSFHGRVFATPSAATVIVDGNEVFNGQVGVGQPLDTEIVLASTILPSGNVSVNVPVSVAVTSGVITVGQVLANDSGFDIRNNDILINGQAPEWPGTPLDLMPGGSPESPNWQGWFFEVSAGETITFTIAVQKAPV